MLHLVIFICAMTCNIFAISSDVGNFSIKKEPKIVVVGAGPSGIAAASKLFENGLKNVTILEAENRTGGRVYTTRIGRFIKFD